jgi:hypothetical protein
MADKVVGQVNQNGQPSGPVGQDGQPLWSSSSQDGKHLSGWALQIFTFLKELINFCHFCSC